MSRPLKLVAGLAALVLLLIAGLYGYRTLMSWGGRTPEGYRLLTAMPAAQSFEPKVLPTGPVLTSKSSTDLVVDFGYKVGAISYSYSLVLRFPGQSETGRATLEARHGAREAMVETQVTRRWDEPRKAYAVAMQAKLDIQPAVPSLCIKAVIGPRKDSYDLGSGSLCVAQRDASGDCHPETLACGLIR